MKPLYPAIFAFLLLSCSKQLEVPSEEPDQTVTGESKYPLAIEAVKVGTYPALVRSGAGYFYDDVLEYRVWQHSTNESGGDDFYKPFAQYEVAKKYSQNTKGADEPIVLVRQMKHINEPKPGVYEVVEGERLTEWRVEWLKGNKRVDGSIEQFLEKHKTNKGEPDAATSHSR